MTFSSQSENDYLIHYGVLGMKWGVRKNRSKSSSGGTKTSFSTKRKAKKDAKEFARAKMYYGEGAGNRRKLIKNTVESRSKNLPGYKQEFDKRYASQDMSKHVSAAKRERKVRDTSQSAARTARGLVHATLGNIGKASAAAATIYLAAKATGVDKKVAQYAQDNIRGAKIYVNMWRQARRK